MGTTYTSAHPYVTGAVHFLIGREGGGGATGGGGKSFGPEYLGTSEFSPTLEIDKQFVPLFNDLGGPLIPFDLCYAGAQAFVACDLTRYNPEVVRRITDDPTYDETGGGDVLVNAIEAVGTLEVTEGFAFTLYMVFPYASYSVYSNMYKGLKFPACCAPKIIYSRLGTQPKKVHCSFHCIRGFDPKNGFTLATEATVKYN